MGVCWVEGSHAPQLPMEEGSLLSFHLSQLLSPALGEYYEPHVCEIKNKSDFLAIAVLTLPDPCPPQSHSALTLTPGLNSDLAAGGHTRLAHAQLAFFFWFLL